MARNTNLRNVVVGIPTKGEEGWANILIRTLQNIVNAINNSPAKLTTALSSSQLTSPPNVSDIAGVGVYINTDGLITGLKALTAAELPNMIPTNKLVLAPEDSEASIHTNVATNADVYITPLGLKRYLNRSGGFDFSKLVILTNNTGFILRSGSIKGGINATDQDEFPDPSVNIELNPATGVIESKEVKCDKLVLDGDTLDAGREVGFFINSRENNSIGFTIEGNTIKKSNLEYEISAPASPIHNFIELNDGKIATLANNNRFFVYDKAFNLLKNNSSVGGARDLLFKLDGKIFARNSSSTSAVVSHMQEFTFNNTTNVFAINSSLEPRIVNGNTPVSICFAIEFYNRVYVMSHLSGNPSRFQILKKDNSVDLTDDDNNFTPLLGTIAGAVCIGMFIYANELYVVTKTGTSISTTTDFKIVRLTKGSNNEISSLSSDNVINITGVNEFFAGQTFSTFSNHNSTLSPSVFSLNSINTPSGIFDNLILSNSGAFKRVRTDEITTNVGIIRNKKLNGLFEAWSPGVTSIDTSIANNSNLNIDRTPNFRDWIWNKYKTYLTTDLGYPFVGVIRFARFSSVIMNNPVQDGYSTSKIIATYYVPYPNNSDAIDIRFLLKDNDGRLMMVGIPTNITAGGSTQRAYTRDGKYNGNIDSPHFVLDRAIIDGIFGAPASLSEPTAAGGLHLQFSFTFG